MIPPATLAGVREVGQVRVARAVLVQGQQCRLLFAQRLRGHDRPGAAVTADGEHRLGIHLIPEFPTSFLRSQFRQGMQPPIAHYKVRLLLHSLLGHSDRRGVRYDLAELARHKPSYTKAAEEIIDRILGAMVGAVVVAG
jgi:hypothetical protein